jgi:hypothetical protein
MTFVDVQMIQGLGLPYIPGAEIGLLDRELNPLFADAWQAFVDTFPTLSLDPLFDELPVEQLGDLLDGVRLSGEEPPDSFSWFTLACDESEVDAVVAAVQALPLVAFAAERPPSIPAANVSYGTNPTFGDTRQIQKSPVGVDAIYAWQILGGAGDGIHVGDIEHAWRLDHNELIAARIVPRSIFPPVFPEDINHGTGVAGILVSSDNGDGTVGIVPNAALDLFTSNRGFFDSVANAILVATANLVRGDVLLIELGQNFFPIPPAPPGQRPSRGKPDILIEADRTVQTQIKLATQRGITVIEPAGNGGVNLDTPAFLAHTRPASDSFSGAIVVGSAFDSVPFGAPPSGTWNHQFLENGRIRQLSSFGSRVDCFASGQDILAPASANAGAFQLFSGTSGASAIIAGLVASLQAMTLAAKRDVLSPAFVRTLLRDTTVGTLPAAGAGANIGAMPDLRRITRQLGLMRILPVSAAAIGGDALLMVHLDADNRMIRRHFTLLTGWGQPLPSAIGGSSSDLFELTAAQPVVTSSDEVDPITRIVFDGFFSGPKGIHHMFWDSRDQSGDVSKAIAPITAAAQGRALAAVRPLIDLFAIAAINPEGRLVILTGDPQIMLASTSAPIVVDAFSTYRRTSGPTIASRGPGLADIVAIDDTGVLNWFTGTLPAGAGSGMFGPVTEPSGISFDAGARPALISTGSLLLTLAVGTDGLLRAATIDPVLLTMDAAVLVDAAVAIDPTGPVALGRTALNVVALAVDTQGTVRAATRLISGGNWTPLIPLLSLVTISPLGGVAAVTIDFGVMAIAVGVNGVVFSALSADGLIWSPLVPLP